MIERRELVGGSLLAGAAAALLGDVPAAAAQRSPDDDGETIARALNALRDVVRQRTEVSPELTRIREQQHVFLKSNQKFPDFMEVGIEVWENVYDWHVRHQLPLTMTRSSDGRYIMTVMFTTLILRPDQGSTYIGFGFDAR
jgi:hypothetical protein